MPRFQRQGNRFVLVNTNAPADLTRVNGAAVSNYHELHDGDRIQLGQVVLRFQMRTAQPRRRLGVPVRIFSQRPEVRSQRSEVRGQRRPGRVLSSDF